MLLGEHAVLHGRRALVCAVDRRISMTFRPRCDRLINVASSLGNYTTDLDALRIERPFRFLLTALDVWRRDLSAGLDIDVRSNFSDKVGLGSSAAVTVAGMAGLRRILEQPDDPTALFKQSRQVIRTVQGAGSGADAAAAVYGGVVLFRTQPFEAVTLPVDFPLILVYCGYKTPTSKVIALVRQRATALPDLYERLYDLMDASVAEAVNAVNRKDWVRLGRIFDFNQGLMAALGINDEALSHSIFALRRQPGVLGAKISGSGLGDCAIGLGIMDEQIEHTIPVAISAKGVAWEESDL